MLITSIKYFLLNIGLSILSFHYITINNIQFANAQRILAVFSTSKHSLNSDNNIFNENFLSNKDISNNNYLNDDIVLIKPNHASNNNADLNKLYLMEKNNIYIKNESGITVINAKEIASFENTTNNSIQSCFSAKPCKSGVILSIWEPQVIILIY